MTEQLTPETLDLAIDNLYGLDGDVKAYTKPLLEHRSAWKADLAELARLRKSVEQQAQTILDCQRRGAELATMLADAQAALDQPAEEEQDE